MEITGLQGARRLGELAAAGTRRAELEGVQRALRSEDTAEAGRMLERLFAGMVVREMQRTLPDGFFGGGAGADVFDGWLQEHLGSALAESGALELVGLLKAEAGTAAAAGPGTAEAESAEAGSEELETEGSDDGHH